MAPSWWTWTGTASSTSSRTGPRRRWPAGSFSDRTSKSWPGTARPSTPVAPASVLPGPYRLPTVWHLLANMRQAVERWLQGAHARLRRLPPIPGSPLASRRDRAFPRTASECEAGAESRGRWKAAYDEVRRRHADGQTLLGIARTMGLARATVRKYATADTFPVRLAHGPGPSLLDTHVDYLLGRMGEGCENAMALWRELRKRGYPGKSRQVHRFVAERRTKPTRSGRKPRGKTIPLPETPAVGQSLPSARQLAWLLVPATSALDAVAAALVARVEQDATANAVADLARRFTALVRASGVARPATQGRDAAAELDTWITTAKACTAPAIATFASGLDGDAAAVRSALTKPWSSGQAEGRINRLKLIKRQSYGRAGLDLLQRRLILAA